jgi:hypothetical protein
MDVGRSCPVCLAGLSLRAGQQSDWCRDNPKCPRCLGVQSSPPRGLYERQGAARSRYTQPDGVEHDKRSARCAPWQSYSAVPGAAGNRGGPGTLFPRSSETQVVPMSRTYACQHAPRLPWPHMRASTHALRPYAYQHSSRPTWLHMLASTHASFRAAPRPMVEG